MDDLFVIDEGDIETFLEREIRRGNAREGVDGRLPASDILTINQHHQHIGDPVAMSPLRGRFPAVFDRFDAELVDFDKPGCHGIDTGKDRRSKLKKSIEHDPVGDRVRDRLEMTLYPAIEMVVVDRLIMWSVRQSLNSVIVRDMICGMSTSAINTAIPHIGIDWHIVPGITEVIETNSAASRRRLKNVSQYLSVQHEIAL